MQSISLKLTDQLPQNPTEQKKNSKQKFEQANLRLVKDTMVNGQPKSFMEKEISLILTFYDHSSGLF